MRCHIWPARSEAKEFRLGSANGEPHQGLYFYRNDRLIQAGGWNGLLHPRREYQLARASLDFDSIPDAVRMNPEKSRVELRPQTVAGILDARGASGESFTSWLEDAKATYKAGNRRRRNRAKVLPPGKGFAPLIRETIEEELEFVPGEDAISVRWVPLARPVLFEIDREERVIRLNQNFRGAVLGGRGGSLNDAPLLKAALYLLFESTFQGSHWGPRDKDNIELWQSILTAAAEAETR